MPPYKPCLWFPLRDTLRQVDNIAASLDVSEWGGRAAGLLDKVHPVFEDIHTTSFHLPKADFSTFWLSYLLHF